MEARVIMERTLIRASGEFASKGSREMGVVESFLTTFNCSCKAAILSLISSD